MEVLLVLVINIAFQLTKVQALSRPNFIFVLADDQDLVFNSMSVMRNTLKYVVNEGMTFSNAFIATPVCCPSRTESITGRVFQNIKHNAKTNTCMGIAAQFNVVNNSESLFQVFHRNGYNTGTFGKLTNDMAHFFCNSNPFFNGFTRVNAPCDFNNFYGTPYMDYNEETGNYSLYNLSVNENSYETSYVGNSSLNWIASQLHAQNTSNSTGKPFIAWIGPHSPHCPATPAAWYADAFKDEKAPRTATYNVHVDNHNDFLSTNPLMDPNMTEWVDQLWRDRLRSLLSIDDMVGDIIMELKKYPHIDNNTYIVYTSDHGYHLGQIRIPCNKMLPYDTDIRIPMFLRGPGIEPGTTKANIVGNIDILPTFLSLSGIPYDVDTYDGRTWTDFLMKDNDNNDYASQPWRDIYVSQYQSIGTLTAGTDCAAWYPSSNGSLVPGLKVRPEVYDSNNQAYMIDVNETNNWRLLRTINETDNWMYVEFINHEWVNDSFINPIFYEFYNVDDDPYQIDNIYHLLSESMKNELHFTLMNYGSCHGTSCW